ncbi:DUF5658 family protein [Hyphococcus sp.]|uniref:DUF5658 family protein n=1 Tax=Hyphococcus sp. TaxID=2038636 RepID=UPI003CCBF26E
MVLSLVSPKRRRKLSEEAERSRASLFRRWAAWTLIILYNCIGVADIASTVMALEGGAGVEANPLLAALMVHIGDGWIVAKLALQALISFMVLWFPHWIVLGFFALAVSGNAWIVWNNFVIAGVL